MEVKAAILGTGYMGKTFANSLKEQGVPVTALYNINREKADTFKKELNLGDASVYPDYDVMLEKGDFNVLFICIPPFAHNGQFEKAADCKKHIFIEKPIAFNSARGAEMVSSAKRNGIITMTGFHMRHGAAVKRLAELIKTGKAGRPVQFTANFQVNSLHSPWWINADLCGGQVFEQAIHNYDLCRHFFGEPQYVEGIMANVCHNHLPNYSIEDSSACIAGFQTGAIATITANNCGVPGQWSGRVTALFENVFAEFTDYNNAVITSHYGGKPETETIKGNLNPYFEEVKEFIGCVKSGTHTDCDIVEGYKSLCFVEAVVKSAKLDGAKMVPESL